jgi:serine protease Do
VRGVVVTDLDPSSDAAQKGLRAGDVILSVNRTATTTPESVVQVVEAARRGGRNAVLILVRRGNTPPRFVGVELTRPRGG